MMPASSAVRSMVAVVIVQYCGQRYAGILLRSRCRCSRVRQCRGRSAGTNRVESIPFVIPFAAIQGARLLTSGFLFGLVGRDLVNGVDLGNMI